MTKDNSNSRKSNYNNATNRTGLSKNRSELSQTISINSRRNASSARKHSASARSMSSAGAGKGTSAASKITSGTSTSAASRIASGRSASGVLGSSSDRKSSSAAKSSLGRRTSSKSRKKSSASSLKNRRKLQRYRKFRNIIIAALIIAVAFSIYFLIYANQHDGDDKIAEGIYICNVDVSELSEKEAVSKLEAHLSDLRGISFTFDVDGSQTDINLGSMGLDIKDADIEKLAHKAFNYGKKGLAIKRYFQTKGLKKNGYHIDAELTLDKSKMQSALESHLPKFDGAARNATVKIKNGEAQIVPSKDGLVLDLDTTYKGTLEALNNNWDEESHTIKVSSKTGKADISEDDISQIKDVLGTYTTSFDASSTSAVNINAGTKHLNGLLVMPDEEISVNSVMQPYTEEEGYGLANSYDNGKIVQTMGGGICQVSTTLYNALILSEIKITQRYPHSMPINYVPYGRDAAIAEGDSGEIVKDLCFVNNTGYPIYIYGNCTDDGELTFTVYGKEYRPSDRSIEFAYDIIDKEGKQYEPVDENNKPKDYYIYVVLYKRVFEGSEQVSNETFSESVYLIKNSQE